MKKWNKVCSTLEYVWAIKLYLLLSKVDFDQGISTTVSLVFHDLWKLSYKFSETTCNRSNLLFKIIFFSHVHFSFYRRLIICFLLSFSIFVIYSWAVNTFAPFLSNKTIFNKLHHTCSTQHILSNLYQTFCLPCSSLTESGCLFDRLKDYIIQVLHNKTTLTFISKTLYLSASSLTESGSKFDQLIFLLAF